jgi:type I restriction enzyme S subunit
MKNWVTKKLDEVCELITCGVAARPNYVDVGIPFLSAKNVKNGYIVWNGYNCVSEQTHRELTKHNKPLIGDILYTRVGSYGEAAVIEDDFEFSVFVSLTLIKVDKGVLNNYFLKHYLNSDFVKRLAKKSISGSGVGNLNVGTVREFPILLPPLPEQQRIVAILDECFAALEKAKANAEQNLKNAKELFESYLQGVFENKGEGWEEKTIGEICNLINGKAYKKEELLSKGKYRVLRVGNFFTSDRWYFSDLELDENKYCDKDDLLYAWSASFGPRIWKEEKVIYHYHIWKVIPNEKLVTRDFLFTLFEWDKEKIKSEQGTGTTMIHVSKGSMENRIVPIPSLEYQQTIVRQLDALRAETQKLEAVYQQKLADLEELKKSILQKAFAGELTAKSIAS